ncbi:MAG TPA: manganese-dependent inorganic pyrophosphatase [Clostridiales bacterium]|nr:MAG: manganese-dependent inorganic pyrophosphatase [Clostridiales bacterium GWD2_32_19]HCC07412.1 manganese-dependent inorganic pyrophosphatase [Clostridiales bacterium]
MSKQILVIGHKSPDTDSICAALAYAELKKILGVSAKAVRLGKINKETKFILDYFKVPEPELITEITEAQSEDKKQDIILVDHNEKTQTIDGIDNANIIEVIDHHRIVFNTANPLYYRAEPVGSTSTIIAKLYKEKNIIPTKEMAGLMLSAILSDTIIFKSPTCTEEDTIIAKELEKIAGVNVEVYGKDMIIAGASIEGENLIDVVKTDIKLFEFGAKKVLVSQVTTAGVTKLLENKREIQDVLKRIIKEEGVDSIVLMLTDIVLDGSELLFMGKHSIDIAKGFNVQSGHDSIFLPDVLSRKKQIIPKLTEILSES